MLFRLSKFEIDESQINLNLLLTHRRELLIHRQFHRFHDFFAVVEWNEKTIEKIIAFTEFWEVCLDHFFNLYQLIRLSKKGHDVIVHMLKVLFGDVTSNNKRRKKTKPKLK